MPVRTTRPAQAQNSLTKAEEAVAGAMYGIWRYPDDFRRAVLTAVNTDGDSDTLGTITGSLVGARLGKDAIPSNWRTDVEDSAYLHALGTRLWQARSQFD
ncbi:MAG: ADP-ribosylglycohydrolase family protein [Pirellulaceae bacterium]